MAIKRTCWQVKLNEEKYPPSIAWDSKQECALVLCRNTQIVAYKQYNMLQSYLTILILMKILTTYLNLDIGLEFDQTTTLMYSLLASKYATEWPTMSRGKYNKLLCNWHKVLENEITDAVIGLCWPIFDEFAIKPMTELIQSLSNYDPHLSFVKFTRKQLIWSKMRYSSQSREKWIGVSWQSLRCPQSGRLLNNYQQLLPTATSLPKLYSWYSSYDFWSNNFDSNCIPNIFVRMNCIVRASSFPQLPYMGN